MNVLITGRTGYVANSLFNWLKQKTNLANVIIVSVRDAYNIPIETDTIVHTAALVHKKESHLKETDYMEVNYKLTIDLAEKAKKQGVKHFIFLSTMAVYGIEFGEITERTNLSPVTYYGKSKLAAEKVLMSMQDEEFSVSIIRPPMIYGQECPGNYALLKKLAMRTPIFPNIQNARSMIYIDHLSEFIYQLIVNRDSGIFHPQDPQLISTLEMVKEIANVHQHSIFFDYLSGMFVKLLVGRVSLIGKVFGNLSYSSQLSNYRDNTYQMYSLKQAIERTENM